MYVSDCSYLPLSIYLTFRSLNVKVMIIFPFRLSLIRIDSVFVKAKNKMTNDFDQMLSKANFFLERYVFSQYRSVLHLWDNVKVSLELH